MPEKGLRWKEKRRDDNDDPRERESSSRKGYRDQYRPRSRSRSPGRRNNDQYEDRKRTDRDRSRDRERDGDRHRNRDGAHRDKRREKAEKGGKKTGDEKKVSATAAPTIPQQPMIIVTVNDRLGTKKQIPCFPTDSIRDFKIIVASMIGRQPHEILLKRQGERPFKDVLTLQDYGVSNNVQLDLEVDTGD